MENTWQGKGSDNMIQIRGIMSDWREVTKEQAKRFISFMIAGTMTGDEQKRIEMAQRHLKGITVEELLKEGD